MDVETIILSMLKDQLINGIKESLGIPSNGYIYHMIDEEQKRDEEYQKTGEFLNFVAIQYSQIFDGNPKIDFINYGDTELVYVVDDGKNQQTLLVGQPNTRFGTVRVEYDNLNKLYSQNSSLVIKPTHYFSNGNREAYLTPYIYQARCIASQDNGYGAYIPDPFYHFQLYSEKDCYLVNIAIIANLIRLYNDKEKKALVSCRIGGGDFILEKEFDSEEHNIENVLNRIHLIAARDLITIELSDYINLIRNEFSKRTYYSKLSEKDPSVFVNQKNRFVMKKDAIEDGIALGLKLRKY